MVAVIKTCELMLADISCSWVIVSVDGLHAGDVVFSVVFILILLLELVQTPELHFLIVTGTGKDGVSRDSTIVSKSQASDKAMMSVDVERCFLFTKVPKDDLAISCT